jgi:hypothetical protein
MAVTRIKNNQITDATVVANAKLVDYSISSAKLANNLTYNSDLTITGNLTVQGNATSIDTTITTIEDPVITLASTQTAGTPAVDIGFLGFRGDQSNIAFVWDESADEFVTAFTSTGQTNTTVTITSYADFHTNNANIGGNLVIGGNVSITGNVASLNVTGNITGGNLLTPGLFSATGNITGGNVLTGGQVSAVANVTGGNITTAGLITATGNITGGNMLTAGNVSATGNVTGGNIISGNAVIGNINVSGDITVNSLRSNTIVSASGNVTGGNVLTGGLISATSNITGGNLLTGGLISATSTITSAANITGGNLLTGGLISATSTITSAANITGGNLLTGGLISATGNITGGNLNISGNIVDSDALTITTASGDITLNAAGNINAGTNYINNVVNPVQDQDAATKIYVDNLVSTAISYHDAVVAATTSGLAAATGGTITYAQPNGVSNGIGATLTTTGSFDLIDTANVQTANTRILVKDEANAAHNGVYVWSNATVITRSSDTNTYGAGNVDALGINDYFFVQSGNVNKGSAFVVDAPSGTITFGTSNIQFAQFSSSQTYTANSAAGIVLNGTVFSAKVDNNTTAFDVGGNIIVKAGANLTTPNIGAATGTSLSTTGNVTASSINASGIITATGTVYGGNIFTGGQVTATGNVTGGNVRTAGLITATGNITGGNLLTGGLVSATGNITGGNLLFGSGIVSGTGNIYANNIFANISGNIDAGGANTNIQFNDNDLLAGSPGFTFDKTSNAVVANGNITGSNFTTAGLVTATGNITGGNVLTGGLVSATANVTGGNITTAGLITATGNVTSNNLILTSGIVNGPAAGRITINGSDIDTDFAVDGDTLANVFYVDAGTGTASFGSSTQVTNAIVNFAATTSIVAPVGNTAQRPATGVTGMLRFNTTDNNLEIYDNSAWTAVGVPAFTVIADQQFNGDGSTVAFTLSTSQTTNSCIVSINGVVQIPTIAYSVSTTTLTFTEAPLSGDLIDVRQITTTTSVTAISNSSGNAVIGVSDTAATITAEGNLIPITSNVYTLGNATNRWDSLYVAGNTIYLGTLQLKQQSATTFAVFQADGITAADIDVGNIDVSALSQGNSTIGIYGTGQAYMTVNGNANVLLASNTSVAVNGLLSATGNVQGGNIRTAGIVSATGNITGSFFIGNGSQLTGIDATAIQNGTANVRTFLNGNVTTSAGGTANVVNVTSTGTIITGTESVTGNITGGNILTGGVISATGAITGAALTGTSLTVSTGNITGGNLLLSGAIVDSAQLDIQTSASNSNIALAPNGTGIVTVSTQVSAVGNITGGNLLTAGQISTTGTVLANNVQVTSQVSTASFFATGGGTIQGNANFGVNGKNPAATIFSNGNIETAGLISATGAITGAALTGTSLTVSTGNVSCGNIVNTNANGVGNIGSSGTRFNQVFALASSAQYADLAEKYTADADYAPGTVLVFGGTAEVTVNAQDADRRVAGVVSTNPAYIMNDALNSTNVATVALTGRVPCKVTGTVRKGDLMVAAGLGRARAEADPKVGTVIGKALEDHDGAEGTIEVVVGRF